MRKFGIPGVNFDCHTQKIYSMCKLPVLVQKFVATDHQIILKHEQSKEWVILIAVVANQTKKIWLVLS